MATWLGMRLEARYITFGTLFIFIHSFHVARCYFYFLPLFFIFVFVHVFVIVVLENCILYFKGLVVAAVAALNTHFRTQHSTTLRRLSSQAVNQSVCESVRQSVGASLSQLCVCWSVCGALFAPLVGASSCRLVASFDCQCGIKFSTHFMVIQFLIFVCSLQLYSVARFFLFCTFSILVFGQFWLVSVL